MAKRINGFTYGSGCFVCKFCGKNTRDTGDNGDCGLCPECYDLAGLENSYQDGEATYEEFVGEVKDARITEDAKAKWIAEADHIKSRK